MALLRILVSRLETMERLRSNMWSAETLCRGIFHVAEQPTQGMDAAAVEEVMVT